MRNCNSCHKEIEWNNMRCFGTYSDDKKVWCIECFSDIQDSMKRKWFEQKPDEILTKLNIILEISEKQKKELINIIVTTKKTITSLENYCNQTTLNEVKNGDS